MKFPKSKIFLLFCLSFIVGVGLGRYLNYYVIAGAAMVFVMMATIPPFHLPLFSEQGEKKGMDSRLRGNDNSFWILLVGFLGLVLLFGAWRYKTSFPYNDSNFIGKFYGQEIELEGVVVKDPDVRSNRTNLTVSSKLIIDNYNNKLVGNILLNVGRYPEYQYGDKLKITGKLEEPFESEEFSYKNYLSRFDTYAVMRYPEVAKLAEGQGNKIKAALLAIKHKFQEVLTTSLPEPHASLVLGLILGLKKALPEDLQEALIIAGVSHIVVISGFNISIITKNLLRTRSFLGRRVAFALSFLIVLAFVIMTGAEASVIRAAIMGLLLVIAFNVGRIYQARNALVFAAGLMILQNPKILSFDIGFQLSFAATLGLIYLAPIFEKAFQKIPNFYFLSFRTNLASTTAAILFTLPFQIYYFDRISIVALLANVLILWAVPYTMFFGLIIGAVGIAYLPAAKLVADISWVLLEYLIRLVEFFAKLPFAATSAKINVPVIVMYYVSLVFAIRFYRNKKRFYQELEYVQERV